MISPSLVGIELNVNSNLPRTTKGSDRHRQKSEAGSRLFLRPSYRRSCQLTTSHPFMFSTIVPVVWTATRQEMTVEAEKWWCMMKQRKESPSSLLGWTSASGGFRALNNPTHYLLGQHHRASSHHARSNGRLAISPHNGIIPSRDTWSGSSPPSPILAKCLPFVPSFYGVTIWFIYALSFVKRQLLHYQARGIYCEVW